MIKRLPKKLGDPQNEDGSKNKDNPNNKDDA